MLINFNYKDYELTEFKPGPKLVGFHVYKNGSMLGAVVSDGGFWKVHIVKEQEFIGICNEEFIEYAITSMESYYKKLGESNVVEFAKFKEKKCSK